MTQPQPVKAEAPQPVQPKRLWEQEAEKKNSAKSPKPSATPAAGHNSVSAEQLRSIVQRIERLNEDKAAVGEDIKEVKSEAKGNGFDVPTIMAIVKIRAMDSEKRSEKNQLLGLYASVLGIDPFS